MQNFCYLAAGRESKIAVIFDPAWEAHALLQRISENSLQLLYIVNTHSHPDHVEGNSFLASSTGARIITHPSSPLKKDLAVSNNQVLAPSKDLRLRFLHTPGHSPDSMCIVVNDFALITGDTLFIGECGRVDLPGGDPSALFESFQKLRSLSEELLVYPGHDYGEKKSTTLGEQLRTNYTLLPRTKSEFLRFMNEP